MICDGFSARAILTTFKGHRFISVSKYRFWKHSPIAKTLLWSVYILFNSYHPIPTKSGADAGRDHDLLMMIFRLCLKEISKPKHTRLKFDLEKMKDPNVLETFQAVRWEVCTSHSSDSNIQ